MQPHLKTAIIEFIANEFKLQATSVNSDLSFVTDLKLSGPEISDLLHRLQDALNFILPEDKSGDITTVGDLLQAVSDDEESD